MKIIEIKTVREFTEEMERFRRSAFHGPSMDISSADKFDPYSSHLVAHVEGVLAGMVRLTPEPPSVLQEWSDGKAQAPKGQGVLFASRAVVAETFRGCGIYKILMLECMNWCRDHKIEKILGTIALDFPFRPFLSAIGFYDAGEPCLISNYPVPPSICRCICCDLKSSWPLVIEVRQTVLQRLAQQQIRVNSFSKFEV
jgi:GNAT superfamily N-acetyltransferase